MADESLCRDGSSRVVVSCWVIWRLTDFNILDHTVLADQHKALAPTIAKVLPWSRVIHEHSGGIRELTPCICEKSEHRAINALIFGPCLHDGPIIDTVNQHFINACCLQIFFVGQVARNLY